MKVEEFIQTECKKCKYEKVSTEACHIVERMDKSFYCKNQEIIKQDDANK